VRAAFIIRGIIALMIEAARTSETSVDIQLRTRQYIPEDSELHTRRRENLKSHLIFTSICVSYQLPSPYSREVPWSCLLPGAPLSVTSTHAVCVAPSRFQFIVHVDSISRKRQRVESLCCARRVLLFSVYAPWLNTHMSNYSASRYVFQNKHTIMKLFLACKPNNVFSYEQLECNCKILNFHFLFYGICCVPPNNTKFNSYFYFLRCVHVVC
jgi:hypothetical protein